MDTPYGKELKQVATDALQSVDEELPPVSSKEAAEMVAKAAMAALNREAPEKVEEKEGAIALGDEDEHWAMVAYMEGISEEQEQLDVVARKELGAAFALMHKGLDKIEEAHKMGQEGVRLQREGLIKLNEVCERNPLYQVAKIIENAFGEDTSLDKDKEGDEQDKIKGEELKQAIAKIEFPKPSEEPVRIYDGLTKSGQKRRKYTCPKPKCKYVRVNREAVAAHIRRSHDHVTLGPCNGCGTFCSPNKESLITHMQGCAQGIPEGLKPPQECQEQDDDDDDDDNADKE